MSENLLPAHYSEVCGRQQCDLCLDLGCNCACHHVPVVPEIVPEPPKVDLEITARKRPDGLYEVSFGPFSAAIQVNEHRHRVTSGGLSAADSNIDAAFYQAANLFFSQMISSLLTNGKAILKDAE